MTPGADVTFSVTAGAPPLTYQWRKDGVDLAGESQASLTLNNVSVADAGDYDVVVANAIGSVTSSAATLTVNQPPVAGDDDAGARPGQTLTIPVMKLLANDSDPDGDALSVTAVQTPSSQGAPVTLDQVNGLVTYQAPANGNGLDTFTYTVTDARGATATGTVRVALTPGVSFNRLTPEILPGGDLRLRFLGIPGEHYALEWTHDLTPPITWEALATNQAAANGFLLFTNTPSGNSDFYRTRHVP